MALRTRSALSLLVLAMLSSGWLFPQEAAAKKPTESAAPAQATPESNTRSRTHCEVPFCVQKVLYFSNISQPTDLQDVVNAIRVIADIQRVQQLIGEQIIIAEGTAEQVAIAEKLAAEIDKGKRRFGGLGYRIDLKTQESEGDKKLPPHLYSFMSDARQSARVNLEKQAPPPVPSEPASEAKQPSDSSNIGSIDCRLLAENERTLELFLETKFSRDAPHEPGSATPSLRVSVHVVVELDKPTIISRVDDPDSGHSFTIELTATRVKERP